jgi:bifunctional non-homologous end joining protein LigD
MPLRRVREPFDDRDWIFELKYDGFRALAHITGGDCHLISRNGNRFSHFADLGHTIGQHYPRTGAVLDGEVVCLDSSGRPQFNNLLFRRGDPVFAAFDVLVIGGRDLRNRPLWERKERLREFVAGCPGVLYVDHVDGNGTGLHRLACEHDLEGIVAKHRRGVYVTDLEETTWAKIRNRSYSQIIGRSDLMDREHEPREVFGIGWSECSRAMETLAAFGA